jgi:maltoporin
VDAEQRPNGTPSGPIARVQVTITIYIPYRDLLSSGDTTFGLPEVWAAIGNLLPVQPSMKSWAGNCFYRGGDFHISDFCFYNMSGAGDGLEDLQPLFGKMALAWIVAASHSGFSDVPQPDLTNEASFSKANLDLRPYDVSLPFGKEECGLVYARADSGLDAAGNSVPHSAGVSSTLLHTRDSFISADGLDWAKADRANISGNLCKLSLAPQVSLGGRFMSHPVIRAFVTCAHGSDDFVDQVAAMIISTRTMA